MLNRAALLVIALWLPACVHVEEHQGPPAHAPAHGQRAKHGRGSVDMVFDSDAGVYVVVGWPDHYWYRDRYYRWLDSRWMVSVKLDGDWADCSSQGLPPGLARKHGRDNHPVPASRKR